MSSYRLKDRERSEIVKEIEREKNESESVGLSFHCRHRIIISVERGHSSRALYFLRVAVLPTNQPRPTSPTTTTTTTTTVWRLSRGRGTSAVVLCSAYVGGGVKLQQPRQESLRRKSLCNRGVGRSRIATFGPVKRLEKKRRPRPEEDDHLDDAAGLVPF